MKMPVDRPTMRRHIIMEAAQSIGVLSSAAAFMLSCAWMVAVGTGTAPLATAVFSPLVGLSFFVYTIMFEGQAIRDRLLKKYEEGEKKKKDAVISKTKLQKPYAAFLARALKTRHALSKTTSARRAMLLDSLDDVSHQVEKVMTEFCAGSIEDKNEVACFILDATSTLDHIDSCLEDEDPVKIARLELAEARERTDRAKVALESLGKRTNMHNETTE